ncbi:Uu.00g137720.m01.CDS01 [Anthostomella pinea]|uniref:Uu.00g137720.m01.CDS01 n=1 Tax=Anthostomella pinea TaxID=933095 RepID=A0AAI8YIQ5_9PEZI|nr:Uu.00g137720.m01.CDS01 [Anthostomella pinea]
MAEPTAPKLTYKGNCHCGLVRFTAALPDIRMGTVNRCNCSICTKNGYLLVYPRVEDVTFVSGLGGEGDDSLSVYRFGSGVKPHRFCRRWGTSIFIDFSESDRAVERAVVAINLRTFAGIEDMMGELKFRDVDGKHMLGPPYRPPE